MSEGLMAIRTLPNPEVLEKHHNGKSMRALQIEKRSVHERLVAEGRLHPATIVNFNPIALDLGHALIPYKVPASTDPGSLKITVGVEGATYTGSYVTDKTPLFQSILRSAQDSSDELAMKFDVVPILPIEKAYAFYQTYNDVGSNNMGGVLIFQGDIRVLEKRHVEVEVPSYRDLPNKTRSYFTEKQMMKDVLGKIFARQRLYCESRIARAQASFDDPDQRKNVTDQDRAWAQYAFTMGWKDEEPKWVYTLTPSEAAKCKGCGAVAVNGAYFCTCGRPYDAFTAYMAGENVAPVYLANLGKDQMAEVKKESERRKKALEGLV